MNNKISCKNKTSYVYKATQNLNTDVEKIYCLSDSKCCTIFHIYLRMTVSMIVGNVSRKEGCRWSLCS